MSLLQEALKRKEQDESQPKPEAGSTEKLSSASPAENERISAVGQQAAEVKKIALPSDSPPQSMPVAGQMQAAVSQSILAPPRLAESAKPAELAIGSSQRVGGAGEVSLETGPLAEPRRRKVSLLWVIVIVIAIFVGLTFTAGIAFLFYRASPAKAKTVQQAGPIINPTAVVPAGTNILAGQLISAPNPKPESAVVAEIEAHQPSVPAVKTEPTAAIAQTQIVTVAHNAESKPTPAKLDFFKPKASPAVSQAVKWPVLKLTGILRGAGKTESTAFINGKMISAGQTIADVTIVEVQSDGVILKYGDEKRFLRVGATSY